jgi:hypothetical protein
VSDDEPSEDLGGDPACWLDQVCDACGALIEREPHDCPRAGDATERR